MRRWRVTKLGWVVIGLLVAAALLLTFTGGTPRFIGGVIAGVVLLLLVSEGLSGPGDVIGSDGRKDETLRQGRFAGRGR